MRTLRICWLVLPLALLACGGDDADEGDVAMDTTVAEMAPVPDAPVGAAADSGGLVLQLVPVAGAPSGMGGEVMVAEDPASAGGVVVAVSGAPAGATLAAHIHTGDCATGGGVAAPLEPITVGQDGSGRSSSSVGQTLPELRDGNHYVQVHEPNGSPGAPVLCVDIVPAA